MIRLRKLFVPALSAAVIVGAAAVGAQTTQEPSSQHHQGMMGGGMMGQSPSGDNAAMAGPYQQWMSMNQQMMEQRQAMDTRLEKLLADMNSATGSAKVSAMAAVINELVHQRSQLTHMMMTSQPMMMQMMMASGHAGGMGHHSMMGWQDTEGNSHSDGKSPSDSN